MKPPRQLDLELTGDNLAGVLRDHEAEMEAHPDTLKDRLDRVGVAFAEFHRDHPWVYARLVSIARRYRAAHASRGIGFFFEVLRHERIMATDQDGFKLNNNFRSRYARLIERENPDLAGFFRKRKLRAKAVRNG